MRRCALALLLAAAAAALGATAHSATRESIYAEGRATVTGDLSVGSTLTGHDEIYDVRVGGGVDLSGQWSIGQHAWFRCKADGSWCGTIAGTDSATYTLRPEDAGCAIEYDFTVVYQGRTITAVVSDPLGPIAPAQACIRDWQVNPGPPPPPQPPPAPPAPYVPPLTVVTADLPVATLRYTYSILLLAGGRTPYTTAVTAGALPPGLALLDTGLLTGIPTQEGTYTFTLRAADPDGRTTSGTFTIPVHPQRDFGGTTLPKGPPLLLPSPARTPGVRNPAVRQATVARTICSRAWLARERPRPAYLSELKLTQLRQYGETSPPAGYVEDHLIPIELGGHPTSRWNIWPEPRYQSPASKALERVLERRVCRGTMPLAAAQRRVVAFKRENG